MEKLIIEFSNSDISMVKDSICSKHRGATPPSHGLAEIYRVLVRIDPADKNNKHTEDERISPTEIIMNKHLMEEILEKALKEFDDEGDKMSVIFSYMNISPSSENNVPRNEVHLIGSMIDYYLKEHDLRRE